MFKVNKEELKNHMHHFIRDVYVDTSRRYSGSDQISTAVMQTVNNNIDSLFQSAVRELVAESIEELIDKLYTVDDMEKDLGLK
jgi:hypothetical protein